MSGVRDWGEGAGAGAEKEAEGTAEVGAAAAAAAGGEEGVLAKEEGGEVGAGRGEEAERTRPSRQPPGSHPPERRRGGR